MSEDKPKEEEKIEKKSEVKMVQIEETKLTELLQRMERLEASADKSRLQWYDAGKKPKELTRVRLNAYEDKEEQKTWVILGWDLIFDESFIDGHGLWREKQIIKLHLENKKDVEINYLDFIRRMKKQDSEVTGREVDDETGYTTLTVKRLSDSKIYKVDSRFIN